MPAGTRARAQDGRDPSEEARKQYAQGLHEASAMVKDRQFANAQAKLDVLLTQRPREPQARFLKGVVQTEQGQDAAAIATFSALIADYPELPEPYNNLAVLYAQKGEYEGARIALESAVRPRRTGRLRTRTWATSTFALAPPNMRPPRSSIARTRRRPPSSISRANCLHRPRSQRRHRASHPKP